MHTYLCLCFAIADDSEHWIDRDSDLDADFHQRLPDDEPSTPLHCSEQEDTQLNAEEQAVVWWIVAFTCIFQTLHSLPSRAVGWLLQFLGVLLVFFWPLLSKCCQNCSFISFITVSKGTFSTGKSNGSFH